MRCIWGVKKEVLRGVLGVYMVYILYNRCTKV
jgi:hypothetical protein